jgi:ABC-2 type transport system ATP-binding protein
LEVGRGEIFGLLGLEGAGKTTLIKILLGLQKPTRGRALVLGRDTLSLHEIRHKIGYVSETKALYDSMRVLEIISFCKKLSPLWDEKRVWNCLKDAQVSLQRRVKTLSRSQQAFLCLALSLGSQPEVLLLDEPADAFDDVGRELFTKQLLDFMEIEGRTILIASKGILDMAAVVDRVAILREGEITYCGVPGEMQEKFCKVRIVPKGPAAFWDIPGVYRVEQENRSYLIKIQGEKMQAISLLQRIPNEFFDVIPMSLRDTYLELAKEGKKHV